jgi:hypothetical protein
MARIKSKRIDPFLLLFIRVIRVIRGESFSRKRAWDWTPASAAGMFRSSLTRRVFRKGRPRRWPAGAFPSQEDRFMKRIFGVALLALPLAAASVHAEGWPFNIQAGGSFYLRGANGTAPQAGPWYLYWPLEAHFVAPAPTGYPYWPAPQGLPPMTFGGPTCPPGVPVAPPPVAAAPVAPPPVATAPVAPPPVMTMPAPAQPVPQAVPQPTLQATPPAGGPQIQLPPYLQPTSYYPVSSSGQPPGYWYDR